MHRTLRRTHAVCSPSRGSMLHVHDHHQRWHQCHGHDHGLCLRYYWTVHLSWHTRYVITYGLEKVDDHSMVNSNKRQETTRVFFLIPKKKCWNNTANYAYLILASALATTLHRGRIQIADGRNAKKPGSWEGSGCAMWIDFLVRVNERCRMFSQASSYEISMLCHCHLSFHLSLDRGLIHCIAHICKTCYFSNHNFTAIFVKSQYDDLHFILT